MHESLDSLVELDSLRRLYRKYLVNLKDANLDSIYIVYKLIEVDY
jgi:hypothetical protein